MCQTLSNRVLGLPDSDFPNYPYKRMVTENWGPRRWWSASLDMAMVRDIPWYPFHPFVAKKQKGNGVEV